MNLYTYSPCDENIDDVVHHYDEIKLENKALENNFKNKALENNF